MEVPAEAHASRQYRAGDAGEWPRGTFKEFLRHGHVQLPPGGFDLLMNKPLN